MDTLNNIMNIFKRKFIQFNNQYLNNPQKLKYFSDFLFHKSNLEIFQCLLKTKINVSARDLFIVNETSILLYLTSLRYCTKII